MRLATVWIATVTLLSLPAGVVTYTVGTMPQLAGTIHQKASPARLDSSRHSGALNQRQNVRTIHSVTQWAVGTIHPLDPLNTEAEGDKNNNASYTLEYSPNFHRHVVRDSNGTVLQSFLWLDEAVLRYPTATLLPIVIHAHRNDTGLNDAASNDTTAATAVQCTGESAAEGVWVAGGGRYNVSYPTVVDRVTRAVHRGQVVEIFQSLLKWYPTQVERLMEQWPPLHSYPAHLLEERLQFLLAPLPFDSTLEQANVTDDIDWPYLLHSQGYGAGMTVGQVSHALQVLPEPLLLRLDAYGLGTHDVSEQPTTGMAESLTQLYEETPPLVLQMTLQVLHLWVTGVTHVDVLSLAYLHWQGWDWRACRIVLHALRCSRTSSSDMASGVVRHDAPRGTARTPWHPRTVSYVQARLQIRPWHMHALWCTHSRVSSYTRTKLRRNLDFLQDRLQLTSAQLQAMILIMPSLLGASTLSLESRIDFWTNQVGLTPSQLLDVVTQKPSLLQYSVTNNLGPKFDFFVIELGLVTREASTPLVRMTRAAPELWGRSLDRFLRPVAREVCAELGDMSLLEFGQIVAQQPRLLLYSVSNLVSKLVFLKTRLGLSGSALAPMVQSSPRLLFESVETSLKPKLDLVERLGGGMSIEAIQDNPSLLLKSKVSLQQRLEQVARASTSIVARTDLLKKRRASKGVWLLSVSNETEVELEFSEVAAAAAYAGTSESNMYLVLRLERLLKGRRYVYAHTPPPLEPLNVTLNNTELNDSLKDAHPETDHSDAESAHLTIHTAGCAFPPEDTVRGRRRSGGMALQIRTWSTAEWREICSQMWKGQRLRLLSDTQTLILGYPYTRPSRPRCSLYACHEALRVATQWMSQVPDNNVTITIVCESNFVWELLRNTSQLAEWGLAESKANFVYTGAGLLHQVNPDILYPLSRQVYHLCQGPPTAAKSSERRVTVRFIASDGCERSRRLRDGAKFAAKRMYDSER